VETLLATVRASNPFVLVVDAIVLATGLDRRVARNFLSCLDSHFAVAMHWDSDSHFVVAMHGDSAAAIGKEGAAAMDRGIVAMDRDVAVALERGLAVAMDLVAMNRVLDHVVAESLGLDVQMIFAAEKLGFVVKFDLASRKDLAVAMIQRLVAAVNLGFVAGVAMNTDLVSTNRGCFVAMNLVFAVILDLVRSEHQGFWNPSLVPTSGFVAAKLGIYLLMIWDLGRAMAWDLSALK
jgi:hypothetical protein